MAGTTVNPPATPESPSASGTGTTGSTTPTVYGSGNCWIIYYDHGDTRNTTGVSDGPQDFIINYLTAIGATDIDIMNFECGTPAPADPQPAPVVVNPPPSSPPTPPTSPPSIGPGPFDDPPLPTASGSVDIGVEIVVILENILNSLGGGGSPGAAPTPIEAGCCNKIVVALGAIAIAIAKSAPAAPNPDPVTCAQLQEAAQAIVAELDKLFNVATPALELPAQPVLTAPTAQEAIADLATWENAWNASIPALPGIPGSSQ